jgi:GTPase SAR1 family protein
MAFFATSAKTGFNVNEAFEEIVRKVIELRDLEDLA